MKKKFLIGSAVLSFSAFLSVAALAGVVSHEKLVEAEAAAPYTVYIVSGNSNWTSWNNRFVLGDNYDNGHWSSPTTSPRDTDFNAGDSSNFNKAKIGSTEYNFQKVTISDLTAGNWVTVQKYNSNGSSWEANGYNGSGQDFCDGANKIINGTNNVIYVEEYDGRPWLRNAFTQITGWYYKVKCLSNLDGSKVADASLQKGTYTPANPTAPSGYTFGGWYTNQACTNAWGGTLTADVTLYAKFETQLTKLGTPVLTKGSDNSITWSPVANASSYDVTVDGVTTSYATSATLKVDGLHKPGSHTISVKAVGDGITYADGDSASESYSIAEGFFLFGTGRYDASADASYIYPMVESAGKYSVDVALAANDEFEAVYAHSDETIDWQDFNSFTMDPKEAAQFPVSRTSETSKSMKASRAGNYRVTLEFKDGELGAFYTIKALDYVENYKLVVGSTEYNLVQNAGNEYKAVNVNLTRGDVLGFKDNGSVQSSTAKVIYNNNLDSSKKVFFSASNVTVYVDVVTGTIFAEGMPNIGEGYHVVKNGSSIITMTHNENPSDPSYTEWYTNVTSFAANDVLTFLDKKASGEVLPVEFKIATINAGGLGNKFEVTADGIKAKEAVDTAIYLKLKSGADEVYFGEVSEAELKARQFASDFLTAINNVCDPQGVTTDTDDLADAWADQVTAFGKLIKGAQDILKAATAGDSVKEIRDFIAQYTYVLTKYGKHFDASTRDFLSKGITPNPVAENHLLFTKDSTTTIAMVTIIAVVGLTAIGSVVYLRARKHQ